MKADLLSELEGSGVLVGQETGTTIPGSWRMEYSLKERSAPTFTFYSSSIEDIGLRDRKLIMSEACTNDGRPVNITGIDCKDANIRSSGTDTLRFEARDVTVGEEEPVDEIRFFIPNLMCPGMQPVKYGNKSRVGGRSAIQIRNSTIEIAETEDYPKTIRRLRREGGGLAITASVTIKPENGKASVVEITELMDTLNELLNLAMGKFVLWSKCEGYQNNQLVWEKFRIVHLHKFGPLLGLITADESGALAEFISSSFNNFETWLLQDRDKLLPIIHSYIWGLNLPLFETQIYSLSYALEGLANMFLDKDDRTYFSKSDGRELRIEFKNFVVDKVIPRIRMVDPARIDEFKGDKLEGRISFFFHRPFQDQIRALLKECYGVDYNDDWTEWIREFVRVRNYVTHHKQVDSPTQLLSAWCKGLELIELIILGNRWCSTANHESKISLFRS